MSAASRPAPWFAPIAASSRSGEPVGRLARGHAGERLGVLVEGQERDDRQRGDASHRRDRVVELVEVVERLEHEQVGAALLEDRGLLGEQLAPLGRAVAASPSGPIAPPMKTSRPVSSRASRASFTPVELIRSSSSSRKCAASLRRFAPNVFVSISSAPALMKLDVERHDRLGRAQVRLLGRAQPRHRGRQKRAHAAVGDDRRALAEAGLEAAGHAQEARRIAAERSPSQVMR